MERVSSRDPPFPFISKRNPTRHKLVSPKNRHRALHIETASAFILSTNASFSSPYRPSSCPPLLFFGYALDVEDGIRRNVARKAMVLSRIGAWWRPCDLGRGFWVGDGVIKEDFRGWGSGRKVWFVLKDFSLVLATIITDNSDTDKNLMKRVATVIFG